MSGADIRDAAGEIDLFDGSPPCQSFSTVGSREKSWGKVIAHNDGTTQRSDDLFDEWIRIVGELRPKAVIAENVAGLVKGPAIGYFRQILANLRDLGYTVQARLIDAMHLGVPQSRPRVIIAGVRSDLERDPRFPIPAARLTTVRDALPWLRSGILRGTMGNRAWTPIWTLDDPIATCTTLPVHFTSADEVAPPGTIIDRTSSSRQLPKRPLHQWHQAMRERGLPVSEPRVLAIGEVMRLCSFPDDFVLEGTFEKRWARLGNAVPPLMMRAISASMAEALLA